MRFIIVSASVTALALFACASSPNSREGRTDSKSGAAQGTGPCSGKNAGDACSLCPPSDPGCVETMELKVCSASGECTSKSGPVPPPASPPAYQPCAGKNAGDACTVCDPTDAGCAETMELKVCNASGACTSQTSPPTYDPCGGKKAGDSCTLCDPTDAGCVETAVLKACDGSGVCR